MRIFLTGGSGYVGRNLLRHCKEQGIPVVALARSDAAKSAVINAGAIPAMGDLDDVSVLSEGMRGCDVVVHGAAYVEDWGPDEMYDRVNIQGTRNVLEAAKKAGVKRVVHVSTEAVLVDGPPIVNADE